MMSRETKFSFMWQHQKSGKWMDLRYTLDQVIAGDPYDDMSDNPLLRSYHHVATRQYTGLKDKNRVELYEDDIAIWHINGLKITGKICWEGQGFDMRSPSRGLICWDSLRGEIEKNGTIHENPELLENGD